MRAPAFSTKLFGFSKLSTPSFGELKDRLRYRWRLHFQPRKNHIYSKFYRFPTQLAVLMDDVLPQLLARRALTPKAPLQVAVFACCAGEEAYTLAYLLSKHRPDLPVSIRAYDLVPELVAEARAGLYTVEHVRSCPFVTDALVAEMFEPCGDQLRIKPSLAAMVSFATGDITNPTFMTGLPRADLVFAQNVLFHLPRPVAREAFKLLAGRLQAGGALFINGMDSDMRESLTREAGLKPMSKNLEVIHDEARVDRGADWANNYWGREPLTKSVGWVRRYCTIFLSH